MPIPRVAIVGRPNVGKSSLLNMLVGDRVSIVDDAPGVTRDRVDAVVDLPHSDGRPDRPIELTDTGGFGVYVAEGERFDDAGKDLTSLTDDIEQQIAAGVSGADLILFAIDTQAGITPQDEEIARMLREQKLGSRQRENELVPVRVVATKCDGPKWETHALEFSALGFDEPLMCSAKNNYMRRELSDRLYDLLPDWADDPHEEPEVDLKVAIIGKRNAGKSTLVNALAGEERVIVSEIAGTTRDSIDVKVETEDGKSVLVIDTAGLRRKRSFSGPVEWYAFDRAKRAIDRADAILMLIDATTETSQVDEQLAMLVQKSFKPVVLVVNKWDLVEGRKNRYGNALGPGDFVEYLRKELKGLKFAPISVISAKENLNLGPTLQLAHEMYEQGAARVGTGELNRVVRAIIEEHPPPGKAGKRPKLYYASQVSYSPPTLVLIVNHPDLFSVSYERYLMNQFRERLPFEEVPIKLVIRARRRDEQKKVERLVEAGDAERHAFDRELLAELPDDPDEYFSE